MLFRSDELVAHGKTIYEGLGGCQGCHQPTGKGVVGQFPALDGSKVVNGPKDAQVALLLNGKAGTSMASFKHLSDKDLAGVMAYTRSSWSNKAAEFVQPIDFTKARNGGVLPAGATASGPVSPEVATQASAALDFAQTRTNMKAPVKTSGGG